MKPEYPKSESISVVLVSDTDNPWILPDAPQLALDSNLVKMILNCWLFYRVSEMRLVLNSTKDAFVFYIIFALLLLAAMIETDRGSNRSKIEKMKHLSVPPGFASLTSFYLKKDEEVKKTNTEQEPIPTEIIPEMNDIASYNQIYKHRPWIMLDQSNRKPDESYTEHLPMVWNLHIFFFCK